MTVGKTVGSFALALVMGAACAQKQAPEKVAPAEAAAAPAEAADDAVEEEAPAEAVTSSG